MADVGSALLIHTLALACPPHAATQNINPENKARKFIQKREVYLENKSREIYLGNKQRKFISEK